MLLECLRNEINFQLQANLKYWIFKLFDSVFKFGIFSPKHLHALQSDEEVEAELDGVINERQNARTGADKKKRLLEELEQRKENAEKRVFMVLYYMLLVFFL